MHRQNLFCLLFISYLCFLITAKTFPVLTAAIDAQLKAVIDRTVACWLEVKNKEFCYIEVEQKMLRIDAVRAASAESRNLLRFYGHPMKHSLLC